MASKTVGYALAAVIVVVAIIIAVAGKPSPPQPNPCQYLAGQWRGEQATFVITILTSPPTQPGRACDVTGIWGSPDDPKADRAPGYIPLTEPGTFYMSYGDPKKMSKHVFINQNKFAELTDSGTIANYKVRA